MWVHSCDATCLGFAVFDSDEGLRVERCDECRRYGSDASALVAVARMIGESRSMLRRSSDSWSVHFSTPPAPGAEEEADDMEVETSGRLVKWTADRPMTWTEYRDSAFPPHTRDGVVVRWYTLRGTATGGSGMRIVEMVATFHTRTKWGDHPWSAWSALGAPLMGGRDFINQWSVESRSWPSGTLYRDGRYCGWWGLHTYGETGGNFFDTPGEVVDMAVRKTEHQLHTHIREQSRMEERLSALRGLVLKEGR